MIPISPQPAAQSCQSRLGSIGLDKRGVLVSPVMQFEIQFFRRMVMAVSSSTTPARVRVARSRPETPTEDTAAKAASGVLHCMSRMIYDGCYALAYGVVYPLVFVAQSLPQENPVMHGFYDGGGPLWTSSAEAELQAGPALGGS